MKKNQLLLLLIMLLFIVGCSTKNTRTIAVLKYVTHPALDELEQAFVERLDSLLKSNENFKDYEIKTFNANANAQTAKTISESFVYKKYEQILAIATPAAQAVANTESNIPFLYGAVADPAGAKVIPSNRATGIQNVGDSIIIEALKFIRVAFPKARKLGTLYNSGEQNSVFVQDLVLKYAKEYDFEVIQQSISTGTQISGITESLCNKVDVIYSANDNSVNSSIPAIISVCNKKSIPFVIGDLSTLKSGPLFAIGLKYSSMGEDLADISFSLLMGESIKDYPPQPAPKPEIWLNQDSKEKLNYQFPDSLIISLINEIK